MQAKQWGFVRRKNDIFDEKNSVKIFWRWEIMTDLYPVIALAHRLIMLVVTLINFIVHSI